MENDTNSMGGSWLSERQMDLLAYIYIAMSSLSLLGAGSIVLTVIVKKKVCNSEVRPMFHLSLADFIASACLLIGATLYLSKSSQELRQKPMACSYLTAITSSCFMSTFLLTWVYGYEVYVKMKDGLSRRRLRHTYHNIFQTFPQLYFCYCISWILPLAITLCVFAIDSGEDGTGSLNDDICATCLPVFHYKTDYCFNMTRDDTETDWNEVYKFMFMSLLLLTMCGVVVVYLLALKSFRQIQRCGGVVGRCQYEQEVKVRRWASLYLSIFISIWFPSIVLGSLSLGDDFSMKTFFWLYIVQAVISPLQGFFNCIVYGWRRRGFTRVLTLDSASDLNN